ncbi:MAG: hypothetical protein JRJ03_13225 [Deltaproteobacteria bacterium]|nr:hypothetical protein [Deltaproteobacteria bacterium]
MVDQRKEIFKNSILVLVILGLCSMITGVILPTIPGHAQQRVKPEVVLPDHYPDGFDGYGRIERLGEGEIVIDEELWKLAPDVEYYMPGSPNPSAIPLDEGDLVGYLINEEEKIMSLWLIKK